MELARYLTSRPRNETIPLVIAATVRYDSKFHDGKDNNSDEEKKWYADFRNRMTFLAPVFIMPRATSDQQNALRRRLQDSHYPNMGDFNSITYSKYLPRSDFQLFVFGVNLYLFYAGYSVRDPDKGEFELLVGDVHTNVSLRMGQSVNEGGASFVVPDFYTFNKELNTKMEIENNRIIPAAQFPLGIVDISAHPVAAAKGIAIAGEKLGEEIANIPKSLVNLLVDGLKNLVDFAGDEMLKFFPYIAILVLAVAAINKM